MSQSDKRIVVMFRIELLRESGCVTAVNTTVTVLIGASTTAGRLTQSCNTGTFP